MAAYVHVRSGSCGYDIRIKEWKNGFSIKCLNPKRKNTMVVTPFDEELFDESLRYFCRDCPQIKEAA